MLQLDKIKEFFRKLFIEKKKKINIQREEIKKDD